MPKPPLSLAFSIQTVSTALTLWRNYFKQNFVYLQVEVGLDSLVVRAWLTIERSRFVIPVARVETSAT